MTAGKGANSCSAPTLTLPKLKKGKAPLPNVDLPPDCAHHECRYGVRILTTRTGPPLLVCQPRGLNGDTAHWAGSFFNPFAQIFSVCERRLQRTSDMITRDGKKLTVWGYGSTPLQLTDYKIIKISVPEVATQRYLLSRAPPNSEISRLQKCCGRTLGEARPLANPVWATGRGGDVTGSANSFLSACRNRVGRGAWFTKGDPRVRIGLRLSLHEAVAGLGPGQDLRLLIV